MYQVAPKIQTSYPLVQGDHLAKLTHSKLDGNLTVKCSVFVHCYNSIVNQLLAYCCLHLTSKHIHLYHAERRSHKHTYKWQTDAEHRANSCTFFSSISKVLRNREKTKGRRQHVFMYSKEVCRGGGGWSVTCWTEEHRKYFCITVGLCVCRQHGSACSRFLSPPALNTQQL